MDINDRLKNLDAWRIKKNIEENAKALAEEERKAKVIADIEALAPRVKDLITLYNAAYEKKLPMPKESSGITPRCKFVADGLRHNVGFMHASERNREYPVHCVGIDGFDTYEIRLFPTGLSHNNGKYVWNGLERFVKDFNNFETEFYEWFDKITTTEG